jgi:phage/conjugal plasmid C-4 type zinc finger TraR family protein
VPDIIDNANDAAERFNQQSLAEHRGTGQPTRPSRRECLDCEEPIPEARRNAVPGCERCIDCQDALENDLKHWRTT